MVRRENESDRTAPAGFRLFIATVYLMKILEIDINPGELNDQFRKSDNKILKKDIVLTARKEQNGRHYF